MKVRTRMIVPIHPISGRLARESSYLTAASFICSPLILPLLPSVHPHRHTRSIWNCIFIETTVINPNGTPSCNIPSLKGGQACHQRHGDRWVKGDGRLWGREAVKLGATLTPRRRLLSDQQCSVQMLRSCLLYYFQNRVQYSILCNAQQTRPLVVDVQHCEQTWSIFTHN